MKYYVISKLFDVFSIKGIFFDIIWLEILI
jgi:hypothetical protein